MNWIAALASILLHLALLIRVQSDPPKPPPPKPISVNLPTEDVELLDKDRPGPAAISINCPHTYEGIGIKRLWGGVVTAVAKGWPADRAGIRPGDTVEPWDIYPVDGYMDLVLVRDGVRTKMRLKTADICFRDAPPLGG